MDTDVYEYIYIYMYIYFHMFVNKNNEQLIKFQKQQNEILIQRYSDEKTRF